MTDPIQNQASQKPLFKGYVGANGNFTRYNLGNQFGGSANAGFRVEGQKAIAPFVDMQAHVGSNYGVDLQAGVDFDFKKDLGLELSAGASFQQDFLPTEYNSSSIIESSYGIPIESKLTISESHPMQARVKGAAKLTYEPNWGSIKVGIEGGIKNSDKVDLRTNIVENTGNKPDGSLYTYHIDTEINHSRGIAPYVTPTLEAEVKLGKDSNVSALLDADLRDIKAGIRYTF